MARYGWEKLPDFWKDTGRLVNWRNAILVPFFLVLVGAGWWTLGWRTALALFILGAGGIESVFYWWLLKPLGVRQVVWWRERQYADWLDYPEEAPWLKTLPGFYLHKWMGWKIARRSVYAVAGLSVIVALAVTI